MVGSGGRAVTDAQAQQIALARLVLADPHTLVLDEATSLIDPRAARHLERSLAAVLEGRTVIAIAHRLFSAHDADRVAVVEDGVIAELGSHDELVAAGGSYAALWDSWNGEQATARNERSPSAEQVEQASRLRNEVARVEPPRRGARMVLASVSGLGTYRGGHMRRRHVRTVRSPRSVGWLVALARRRARARRRRRTPSSPPTPPTARAQVVITGDDGTDTTITQDTDQATVDPVGGPTRAPGASTAGSGKEERSFAGSVKIDLPAPLPDYGPGSWAWSSDASKTYATTDAEDRRLRPAELRAPRLLRPARRDPRREGHDRVRLRG